MSSLAISFRWPVFFVLPVVGEARMESGLGDGAQLTSAMVAMSAGKAIIVSIRPI